LRQGVAVIESLSDPTVGEVRVSASEPIAAGLLPVLIDRFSRRYPKVSVSVMQAPIGSLQILTPQYRDLRERNVDLILGPIIEPFTEDDLASDPLFEESQVVAVGTMNKWARRRVVALANLMDEPWCLQPPNTRAGLLHIDAFHHNRLSIPRKCVISSSVQVQLGLLATQRFLTIFPNSLVQIAGNRHSIKALPTKLPIEPWPLGIVTLKKRIASPAARVFIEMARDFTKTLARPKMPPANSA
jgi:DNA-binding transcriptional LysR family regulator